MSLRLVGYRHSVYTWAARMALAEVGAEADWVDLNPFDSQDADALAEHHPFNRVPVLWVEGVRLYETAAILTYLLPPEPDPWRAARARQVGAIVDNYAYVPLVRQVFSHGVFRPALELESDETEFRRGLAAAASVLAALEEIAAEGQVLDGGRVGLADCHLAPMIGYFAAAPGAQPMLAEAPALARWFSKVSDRPGYRTTRPVHATAGG